MSNYGSMDREQQGLPKDTLPGPAPRIVTSEDRAPLVRPQRPGGQLDASRDSEGGRRTRTLDDYMSGYDTQSDSEFPETLPLRSLPNNAPAPYVYLGFSFSVLAGLCFTSSNVMVKFVPEVSSWQILFIRCITQLLTMVPLIILSKAPILGGHDFATRWRVAAQGLLGGLLLLTIFVAVAKMPLGDCTAIFFSSPACTMVLSCLIIKDHCGLWRCLIVTSLLSGVLILTRPPALFPSPPNYKNISGFKENPNVVHFGARHYDTMGIVSAIAVPVLSAIIVIITRQVKHVHYSVLVFWFGIGGQVVAIFGVLALDSKPLFKDWEAREWVMTIMVALVGILGNILMNKALCWVTPSKVMVIRSFEVVMAYVLQVTVFNVPTHLTDLAGTLLVVVAVLGMGLEDYLMDRLGWRFL